MALITDGCRCGLQVPNLMLVCPEHQWDEEGTEGESAREGRQGTRLLNERAHHG